MINIGFPQALYLLLLIPLLLGIFLLNRMHRRKKLERLGKYYPMDELSNGTSKYMPAVKISFALAAFALIIFSLSRPYTISAVGDSKSEESASGIELMICFDVSNSMLASSTDDLNGISRMQRAKFVLEKLIEKLKNDKVGLIVFAGDAYTQLPITTDFFSAKMFLNNLSTDAVPTQGTAIGAALDMAITNFSPESDFKKAIVLITDVENFEDNAVDVAKQASQAGIQVDVIGVGSDVPVPIPVKAGSTDYIVAEDGTNAMSKLDAKLGKQIANAGDGIYLSGNDPSVVNDMSEQLDKLAKTDYKRTLAANNTNELFPIFIALALLLLLIDTLLPYSKIHWLTKYDFFSKKN